MKLKPGVKIVGINPELIMGLMAAQKVFDALGIDMVVTSVMDGKHSSTSLHYAGNAADIRISNIPTKLVTQVSTHIASALPNDFDVILETDHIHLEFQPRR